MAVKRFLLNKFFSVECPESTDDSQEKKRKEKKESVQFSSVLHPTLLCFKAVEKKKKKKLLAFEKYPFPIGAEAPSPSSPGPLLLSDWSDPE